MNDIKASPAYVGRFQRVCRYIARHLDEPLSLETLSAIAHSSPYHFHRQFSAYTGIPLYRYIQWLRLRRACWRLAFNPRDKVIDIALDAGFQNAESFSRAFRTAFDQSPTAARFIAWRKTSGLSPVATSDTWGIAWDDPQTTPQEAFRFDICGTVDRPVGENAFGVINGEIPGGRCAVVRHHGSLDTLANSVWFLYRDWLPASGETLRDFPVYFRYLNFVHEVAEHELQTDIYLPLA